MEEIKDSFQMLAADAVAEEIDYGHGRVERRRCLVIADLSMVAKAAEWASLQGLVRIESERYHKAGAPTDRSSSVGWKASGKTERELRYCITSLSACGKSQNC